MLENFRGFGKIGRIRGLEGFGRFGEIRKTGEKRYTWKKVRTSRKPFGFRVLGVWEIRKIGKFRRLGDCKIWEIGELGKIFLRGKNKNLSGTQESLGE